MLLGGANVEEWGDHQEKKFFIDNAVQALIPFQGGTSGPIWGRKSESIQNLLEFCLPFGHQKNGWESSNEEKMGRQQNQKVLQ